MDTGAKTTGMKLSVIIPCYNAADTIGEQLDALASQTWQYPWEVIVADNGSTDNSLEIVNNNDKRLPSSRIIHATEIKGAAYTRNKGVEAAQGEFIAFLDADDVAGEGWLEAMGSSLLVNDFVASRFDGKKLNPPGNDHVPQTEGLMESRYPKGFLPFSGACGLGVRKSIHERIGGFDDRFIACEDGDYCWRIQLEGTRLHYEPNAVVHIRRRWNTNGQFKQAMTWGEYNVLLIKKFVPLGMKKPTLKDGIKQWLRVLKLFKNGNNRSWWALGYRIGHIKGSITHRYIVI